MIFMEHKFHIREANKVARASRLRGERVGASMNKELLLSLSAFAGETPALH